MPGCPQGQGRTGRGSLWGASATCSAAPEVTAALPPASDNDQGNVTLPQHSHLLPQGSQGQQLHLAMVSDKLPQFLTLLSQFLTLLSPKAESSLSQPQCYRAYPITSAQTQGLPAGCTCKFKVNVVLRRAARVPFSFIFVLFPTLEPLHFPGAHRKHD